MSFVPYQRGGMRGIVPYVRGGFRGLGLDPSAINPTTIWTPSTGFLSTPGDITSGTSSATYQAPAVVPVPSCSLDTRPGGAAFSDACIAQVLAAQQQNMQLRNNANYAVDLQNCLNTFPQPPDCYSRTFGLTPTGGYTSDAFVQGPQVILDAGGNPVTAPPPVFSTTPNPYVMAPPVVPKTTTPAPATRATVPAADGSTTVGGGGYIAQATDFLSSPVALGGSSFPIWELAGAGLLALFLLKGGR